MIVQMFRFSQPFDTGLKRAKAGGKPFYPRAEAPGIYGLISKLFHDNSSSSALASFKSGVSNPSVNPL